MFNNTTKMMFAVIAVLCPLGILGGTPPDKTSDRDVLLKRATELVSSVPPELSADARIRLVRLHGYRDRGEEIAQLQTAFSLASMSPYPVKLSLISGNMDTRTAYLADTYNLDLDQISLKVRAVDEMLLIDPRLAVEMFREIGAPKLEPRECKDLLGYDVGPYYDSATLLYLRAFDSIDISNGVRTTFLNSVLASLSNPSQIVPAISLLGEIDADPVTLSQAEGVLAHSIANIDEDPRSFSASERMVSLSLYRLESIYKGENELLLRAVKGYMESSLTHEVCSDDSFLGELTGQDRTDGEDSKEFEGFNKLLSAYDISPIRTRNLKPLSIGQARVSESNEDFWRLGDEARLLSQFKQVRDDLSRTSSSSPDWQQQVTQFLSALQAWSGGNRSDSDVFMEKALLFSKLIQTVPAGAPVFHDCMIAYIEFLSTPPTRKDVEMFWLASVKSIIDQLNHVAGMPAQQQARTIEGVLRHNPNTAIALWSLLERAEPQPKI